jgi:hypothetical protein
MARKRRCCDIVYWKHEDGWDAYRREDCHQWMSERWIPRWFDCAIVEDAPTKKAAQQEIEEHHIDILGVCLVRGI